MSVHEQRLRELTGQLQTVRRDLERQAGQARMVAHNGRQVAADIDRLTHAMELHARAAALLSSIGEQRQAQTQQQIETLVTHGLRTIFDDPDLSLRLVASVRAKTPVVDLVVCSRLSDGTTVDTDVINARGGGLAAVVGLLLQVVNLLLTPHQPIMIFDEMTAHLSAEYEPKVAAFLRELVDNVAGAQVIMVTHSPEYSEVADMVHRFDTRDGLTIAHSQPGG